MADGDEREENADSKQNNDANLPDVGNLQIAENDSIEEEYLALDSQLDQLDACLDNLEARNDDLMARMKAYLQEGVFTPETLSSQPGEEGDKDRDHRTSAGQTQGDSVAKASDS